MRSGFLVVGFLLLAILVGVIYFRHLGDVTIIPVDDDQVSAILGQDLRWHPSGVDGPTVDPAVLDRLGKDPITVKVVREYDGTKAFDPIRSAKAIEASERVTDELDKQVAGRRLGVESRQFSNFTTSSAQRTLSKLFAAQIASDVALKDASAGFRDCMKALRFAAFLRRSPVGDEVDLLVRMAGSEIVLAAVEQGARSGMFDVGQLQQLLRGIDPAPGDDKMLADALRADFQKELVPSIRDLAKEGGVATLFVPIERADSDSTDLAAGELDLPATIQMAAQFERVAIANCARAWVKRDESVTQILQDLQNRIPPPPQILTTDSWLRRTWEKSRFKMRMHSVTNSIGLLALIQIESGDREALVGSFRARTDIEAHRMILLFEIYKKQHGNALPGSLDELKPLSPVAFPRDLYVDAPFHYSRERAIFWSVGQNGVDDGGKGGAIRYMSPDIVWSVR